MSTPVSTSTAYRGRGLGSQRTTSVAAWRPWLRARSRVAALQFGAAGITSPATEYTSAAALQDYLSRPAVPVSCRSVYILEGLSSSFTQVLCRHLNMSPVIFENHERLVPFSNRSTGEAGGLPFLPSAVIGRKHVCLKYHEPMRSTQPTGFRNICEASGRHIAATRLMGVMSDIVVARRKCTVWSTTSSDFQGWVCVIVCDPPIRRILTDYSGSYGYDVVTSPYTGGYVDFVPLENQKTSGPPQTSFLDDFIHYMHHHSDLLDLKDPQSVVIVVEKIIASHFLKLAEFLQANIETLQWSLSRRQDLSAFSLPAVEEQWSDLQAWQRRLGEYRDDIEGISLQLRIPLDTCRPSTPRTPDWKDPAVDYRFLHARFKEIGRRASGLNASFATLAGIAGNHHAFKTQRLLLDASELTAREAKNTKALTIIGILFIPFAYVASLFSMADPYTPGGDRFWLYFAVSIPLTGLVLLGYYALERDLRQLGYGGPQTM